MKILEYKNVKQLSDLPEDLPSNISECVQEAFGGTIGDEDAKEHMLGDQVLVAKEDIDTSRVVGFSSTSILAPSEKFSDPELAPHRGAYFGGAAIRATDQGRGIYHVLNRHRLHFVLNENVDFIFTQTQNPRVEEAIHTDLLRIGPELGLEVRHLERIKKIGAYGAMLTSKQPYARLLKYDELDYERGDAFILTWHFDRSNSD